MWSTFHVSSRIVISLSSILISMNEHKWKICSLWSKPGMGLSSQLPSFRPKGIVIACVRPSVRPSDRPSVCLFVRKLYLVCTITRHRFELESPNLHQTYIHPGKASAGIENGSHWPWPSRSFWSFWLRILGNSACPHDYSSHMWARIAKFAPNMHPGIASAGIENGGHWLWPSRSFWPFWPFRLRIVGNSACPPDNSSEI